MRSEAKHYFKYLAIVLGNFKNIAKTLTYCHQHHMCYVLANPSAFLVDTVDSGPGKYAMVSVHQWVIAFFVLQSSQ